MTTLTKYWTRELQNYCPQDGYANVYREVYNASDVDALVGELEQRIKDKCGCIVRLEAELRESKAREVPLPSKHYTDEIIALKSNLANVTAELEQYKARLARYSG